MTPIDWKPGGIGRLLAAFVKSRQSLVTPIDWKRVGPHPLLCDLGNLGRQSLVTPIDWKQEVDQDHGATLARSLILGDAY